MKTQEFDYVYRLFSGKVITLSQKISTAELIGRVTPYGSIKNHRDHVSELETEEDIYRSRQNKNFIDE